MGRSWITGLVATGLLAACSRGTSSPAPGLPPAPSRTLTLGTNTDIQATTERTISSGSDKAGELFTASVFADVTDSWGQVVIPAGSIVNLTITELQAANDKDQVDGRITVQVNSVTVGDRTYPVSATITSMAHTLEGHGVGGAEVKKTAAGAILGGIAGRVIGGNKKGTIIGAVVGGAAGAVIAAQTANRDVVVAAGTPMILTLNEPVTVAVR